MASYEKNIAALRDAEEKAARTIANAEAASEKAREEAAQRAKDEIEKLRKQMQLEFDSKKVDDTKEKEETKAKTDAEVTKNSELFIRNKDAVVDMLVERVMAVKYELPKNVKKDYSQLVAGGAVTKN